MELLNPFYAKNLQNEKALMHGFFSRQGGVSHPPFDSLNFGLSRGDKLEHVKENQKRLAQFFGVSEDRIALMHQVHSADVHIIDGPCFLKGDGLITGEKGLILGVLTADCVPLLAYSPKHQLIAAVHAGWRGALKGVVFSMLLKMKELGVAPQDLMTAIGPSIALDSYEVDKPVYDAFMEKNRVAYAPYFKGNTHKPDHFQFDLQGLVQGQLQGAGVQNINLLGMDTYSDSRHFFSCRRSTHQGSQAFGNQVSALMLNL